MAEDRKYYYLKLKETFFEEDAIMLLEGMENGVLYSNLLMKLYLRSLKNDGRLQLNNETPYTLRMIAALTRQTVETVEQAIALFQQLGLIEQLADGTFYMTELELLVGQTSTASERKRAARQANKLVALSAQSEDVSEPEPEAETEAEAEAEPDDCPESDGQPVDEVPHNTEAATAPQPEHAADNVPTTGGQAADTSRTNSGQTADTSRTNGGQSEDNLRTTAAQMSTECPPEIEKEKEREKELKKEKELERELKRAREKKRPPRRGDAHAHAHCYGKYQNVSLSDRELQELQAELPEQLPTYIDRLSLHMASKGAAYHNHAATIRKWAQEDASKGASPYGTASPLPSYTCDEGESL